MKAPMVIGVAHVLMMPLIFIKTCPFLFQSMPSRKVSAARDEPGCQKVYNHKQSPPEEHGLPIPSAIIHQGRIDIFVFFRHFRE